MPVYVGKCPIPFPGIGNNRQCMAVAEVPDEMLRMRCDPFIRLMSIPTKSFMIKRCENPCAPKDALDRALSACYDHHRQWWAPKSQTVMQCDTYRLFPYGRCQARLCKLQCLPDDPCREICPDSCQTQRSINSEPYRNHTSHMNCHITGPHISNTARGFGRSVDGLFYNC